MRGLVCRLLVTVLAMSLTTVAQARVRITVDLGSQAMHVETSDKSFDWKISSGKPGYETPAGTYKVLWMDRDHHSDEYDGAYMPYAIFFAPGFAIHGFGRSPWGHAASHGCVRLPVARAAVLFSLVKKEGAEIEITGEAPGSYAASGGARVQDAADGYDGRAYMRRPGDPMPGEPGYPTLTARDPLDGVMR